MQRKAPAMRSIGIDRDQRALDRFRCDYPVELVHGCAHEASRSDRTGLRDPPYLHATRRSNRRYRYEYTDADHATLLALLRSLACQVMVSGHPSALYDEMLSDWRRVAVQVTTQAQVRTEVVWFNFAPEPMHWASHAGRNAAERQRIKRKAARWAQGYRTMPAGERLAVLSGHRATGPCRRVNVSRCSRRSWPSRPSDGAAQPRFVARAAPPLPGPVRGHQATRRGKRGHPRADQRPVHAGRYRGGGVPRETTPKTSRNSGLPSSRDGTDDGQTHTEGKSGSRSRGPKARHARSDNLRTVTTTHTSAVTGCRQCGHDLTGTACTAHEQRVEIDIVFETVERQVTAEIKTCPRCHTRTKGSFPATMPGPVQYGPGIVAYVVHLLCAQMVSLKRTAAMIQAMTGRLLSEATLLGFVSRLHQALEPWEGAAIGKLLDMPVLHVDETSLRVDRKNYWIHVCAGGPITVKGLHRNRGCEAINTLGIIPRYGGLIVHDCWKAYLTYTQCKHQLCGAHLLRELQAVTDSNAYPWARKMHKLLLIARRQVIQRPQQRLSMRHYKRIARCYKAILEQGRSEMPQIPPRKKGQRGPVAKSDAHNLHERLVVQRKNVLRFTRRADTPFTNNRSERDIRMAKVKQKVSGCFRTVSFAHAYCRISSYLQTMAALGYNPLVATTIALHGNPVDCLNQDNE